MIKPRFFVGILVLLVQAAEVRPDDWPEFRGPTGQGTVTNGNPPITWSDTKNVTWKQPIPGKGWSSPIVAGGRIFMTTAIELDDGDLSLHAFCHDSATGKRLWDREIFRQDGKTAPKIHQKNSHASATPTFADGRVYVHFGHVGTACLDTDGKLIWRTTELKYPPVHGNGSSPIVVDNALIFHADGASDAFVAALDRATGKVLWKTDRPVDAPKKFSFCTPLLIEVGGQRQLICPGSDIVSALDPKTGKEIWNVRYSGYSVVPRPVYGHGLIFMSTSFDNPVLMAIRPGGQGDLTTTNVAWTFRKNMPQTPSMLLIGDEHYTISDKGFASCFDAKSGKLHWQERVGGNFSASPIYANGRIYLQSEEGVGTVLKAGKQFEVLSRNPLNERSLASYAAVGDALIIRTESNLYRIEKR